MRRNKSAIVFTLLLSALVLTTIAGCSKGAPAANPPSTGGTASGGSIIPTAGAAVAAKSYASPGQRIFLTGIGTDGEAILAEAPPQSQGALLMGGGGCAACHGANGRGGKIRVMTGPTIDSPNITYGDLIKNGFTQATIRSAIRYGLDEEGAPLDPLMPPWQMNDKDVDATVAYMKTLK